MRYNSVRIEIVIPAGAVLPNIDRPPPNTSAAPVPTLPASPCLIPVAISAPPPPICIPPRVLGMIGSALRTRWAGSVTLRANIPVTASNPDRTGPRAADVGRGDSPSNAGPNIGSVLTPIPGGGVPAVIGGMGASTGGACNRAGRPGWNGFVPAVRRGCGAPVSGAAGGSPDRGC